MIPILQYNQFLTDARTAVNMAIRAFNATNPPTRMAKELQSSIIVVSEAHAVKKLKDAPGIVLVAKMYDADTRTDGTTDNYSELNHQLLYVIEKTDAGTLTEAEELQQYALYQQIIRMLKEYIMERKVCDTRIDKPFRTEWEYNVFGGYNGLSITFDLKDYAL